MNLIKSFYIEAYIALKKYYFLFLLASLPYLFQSAGFLINFKIGVLIVLLLSGPLKAGLSFIAIKIIQNKRFILSDTFIGFNFYKNALGTFLLFFVFLIIGLFLFVIPGLLVLVWLSQSFFVLVENPTMEPLDVFRKSKAMMKGNEVLLIVTVTPFLIVSFLLFYFQLQIFSIYILPFQYVLLAKFYQHIKTL